MAPTERPEAEKGRKSGLLNGPRRAQGTKQCVGICFLVFCDVGHTSVAGDMLVS